MTGAGDYEVITLAVYIVSHNISLRHVMLREKGLYKAIPSIGSGGFYDESFVGI